MRSHYLHLTLLAGAGALLIACEQEQPVRSISEFLENPITLEAVMVRCSADRDASRYDPECVNARAAVAQIEAKEEAARRAEFEAQSDRKRQALRRAQEAAVEARRRAAEEERLRREAEYLAQFGVELPPDTPVSQADAATANTPLVVIPESGVERDTPEAPSSSRPIQPVPAAGDGNAAIASSEAEPEAVPTDLESIRDELQRRNEEDRGD